MKPERRTKNLLRFQAAIDKIVTETIEGFDKIKEMHRKGEAIDWDYELARDRKAAIVIKGTLAYVHMEESINRRQEINLQTKKLKNK
ncbi:MAG TPA: hypothetical protein P5136_06410 [Methanofastidiosum sp.]|nr:hypothetical protein [Methanofastidiosum sp.]